MKRPADCSHFVESDSALHVPPPAVTQHDQPPSPEQVVPLQKVPPSTCIGELHPESTAESLPLEPLDDPPLDDAPLDDPLEPPPLEDPPLDDAPPPSPTSSAFLQTSLLQTSAPRQVPFDKHG